MKHRPYNCTTPDKIGQTAVLGCKKDPKYVPFELKQTKHTMKKNTLHIISLALLLASLSFYSCTPETNPDNKDTNNHTSVTDNNQKTENIENNTQNPEWPKTYSLPAEIKYITNNTGDYLYDKFFFIGWSEDGKIAYCVEPADEATGMYFFQVIIQDLVSDKILWKWELPETDEGNPQSVWQTNYETFQTKLNEHKIIQQEKPVMSGAQFLAHNSHFELITNTQTKTNPDFGLEVVAQTDVLLSTKTKGQKNIYTSKEDDYSMVLGAFAPGCLISPYQNRIAAMLVKERWGYEGPPNVFTFKLIGSNLDKGFKPQS